MRFIRSLIIILLYTLSGHVLSEDSIRSHAIAMHGEHKYDAEFKYFDYVNPDAPKGGRLRQGTIGAFDSFNAWIDKGSAAGIGSIETLMTASADEAFTKYCLLCESIEYPEDRSWIIFNLRSDAKWHDGEPITVEDVKWSFETLLEKGRPFYRFYYADVDSVEILNSKSIRFNFKTNENRELPLIIGDLPVFPKHYWADKDFSKTTLDPPLGSGPYRVKRFEAGRFVELERVVDYWGQDLPVSLGLNNFDLIRTDYFRDRIPIRLALKSGELDFYAENTAKSWATEFDISSIDNGWLIKERVVHQAPQGMQAFVFNTRREKFKDIKTREAIAMAFDFNWTNQKIFYNQYTRTDSYFSNSELASSGIPTGEELAILEPYRDQLPEELFTESFQIPKTDGHGWPRENLLQALDLLEQAGWRVVDGVLVNDQNEPLRIEMLLYSSSFERLTLPYVSNLKRLGIDMRLRVVDTSQYINRVREFDFDMVVGGWGQSESPGNEQREYWGCESADRKSSRNTAGICSPVIDDLVEKLIVSKTREQLIYTTRALDRVLLWNHYSVPNWHLPADRILWWNQYDRPNTSLRNGVNTSRWWFDSEKANALAQAREEGIITNHQVDEESTSGRPSGWKLGLLIVLLLVGGRMMMKTLRRKN